MTGPGRDGEEGRCRRPSAGALQVGLGPAKDPEESGHTHQGTRGLSSPNSPVRGVLPPALRELRHLPNRRRFISARGSLEQRLCKGSCRAQRGLCPRGLCLGLGTAQGGGEQAGSPLNVHLAATMGGVHTGPAPLASNCQGRGDPACEPPAEAAGAGVHGPLRAAGVRPRGDPGALAPEQVRPQRVRPVSPASGRITQSPTTRPSQASAAAWGGAGDSPGGGELGEGGLGRTTVLLGARLTRPSVSKVGTGPLASEGGAVAR